MDSARGMRAYIYDDNNTMRIIPRIAWFKCTKRVEGRFPVWDPFSTRFSSLFYPLPSTYDWQEIVITVGSMPTGRTWISRVSFWSSSRDPASKHFFWPVIRRDMNRPRGESIAPGKRYLLCFFHCSLSRVSFFFRLAERRLIFIIL